MGRILVSHRQLELGLPEPKPRKRRGGAREGAGRKPRPGRRPVAHRVRGAHRAGRPVHVTLRARKEASFLRAETVFSAVRRAFGRAQRADFGIVHFSVQGNHVHLIVEARDREALGSGMQGLTTRLARAINGALGRRGRVWADRYHRHDLGTPREVRHALVYVLQNQAKHGADTSPARGDAHLRLDPKSSAVYFPGWTPRAGPALARLRALEVAREGDSLVGSRVEGRARTGTGGVMAQRGPNAPVCAPSGWLLTEGWMLGGAIDPAERPRPEAR